MAFFPVDNKLLEFEYKSSHILENLSAAQSRFGENFYKFRKLKFENNTWQTN